MRILSTLAVAVIGVGLIAGSAFAQAAKKMSVDLTAKEAGTDSKGSGHADLTYDPASKKLTWKLTTKDLTGDALAAHIHGPADPGQNAGPMVTLSPLNEGSATLTADQESALMAGKTYINVHTAAHRP